MRIAPLGALLLALLGATPLSAQAAHIFWIQDAGGRGPDTLARADQSGSNRDGRYATGLRFSGGAASAGDYVYWTDVQEGTISRLAIDGSGVDRRYITGIDGLRAVAVAGGHIFWTSNSGIGRAETSGAHVERR